MDDVNKSTKSFVIRSYWYKKYQFLCFQLSIFVHLIGHLLVKQIVHLFVHLFYQSICLSIIIIRWSYKFSYKENISGFKLSFCVEEGVTPSFKGCAIKGLVVCWSMAKINDLLDGSMDKRKVHSLAPCCGQDGNRPQVPQHAIDSYNI